MNILITSFSYRKPLPEDLSGNGGGHIFDCRALPNPGREEVYKRLNGTDREVISYLEKYEVVEHFTELTKKIVKVSVNNYLERNFSHLSVSFGCTGGQHRSVFCAEKMKSWLKNEYGDRVEVELIHRDCPRYS